MLFRRRSFSLSHSLLSEHPRLCCFSSIDRIIFHVISHCLIVFQISLDFLDRFSVHKNIYDEAKVCRWVVGDNDVTIASGWLISELSSALKTFRLSLEHSWHCEDFRIKIVVIKNNTLTRDYSRVTCRSCRGLKFFSRSSADNLKLRLPRFCGPCILFVISDREFN